MFRAAEAIPASRPARIILVLLLGVVYLAGYNVGPSMVNAERRCVDIATAMYASGEVLVPRLAGEPHLTKPPLFHWLSYGVSVAYGEAGLASVRVVSALAAVGVVVLTGMLGEQLGDRRTAWWAALLTATNLSLLGHGHRGTFDALLGFFVCLTLHGYLRLQQGSPRSGYVFVLGGLIGGFMTKGFEGWFVPLVPMLADRLGRPEPRRAIRTVLWAAPVVLIGSLAWYGYLLTAVPEARAVLRDVITVNFGVRHSGVPMAFHREPFYYYLHAMPVTLLPWLVLLWPAVRAPGQSRPRVWIQRHRLELAWLLGNVVVMSLIPAKASRYLVPLVPAFGLLAAPAVLAIEAGTAAEKAVWRRWLLTCIGVAGIGGAGVVPLWLWVRAGEGPMVCAATALGLCAGLVACGWLAWQGRLLSALNAVAFVLLLAAVPAYAHWVPRHVALIHGHDVQAYEGYQARLARLKNAAGRRPLDRQSAAHPGAGAPGRPEKRAAGL